jgi:tRNA A37 N6-isopentenylltransferase MiaA
MQSIGYREVIAHLEGERTLEETILLVQQHNRNYAKKQLIWFRSYEDLISLSKKKGTLFTKERILFLMVVFIVFSIPLFYRYIFGLL